MSALPPQTPLRGGDYRLEGVIGRGGFGITYRAFDETNQREIAIKECFPAGCERSGLEAVAGDFFSHSHLNALNDRFRDQAKRLERISHPNLANVFDCFDENGTVYVVMELIEGPTLLEEIENHELEIDDLLNWIRKLANALGALHGGGLLHLDVKPENIVLQGDEPILLDFDLVQPLTNDNLITRPLALAIQCGTPGYAPLEQYTQRIQLSPATDLYALGATFYHLVTGTVPLSAVERAAGLDLPSARARRTDLAPHLGMALEKALELKPEDRIASGTDFVAALRQPTDGDEDTDYSAVFAPQMMKHGTGYHRVVLTSRETVLPKRCVCCHDKADTTWTLSSASGRWEMPLCRGCQKHQLAAKAAGIVTFWGSLVSLLLAVVVVISSFVTASLLPLLLGPVCIVLNFAALSYGALKSSRAEEMLKKGCCDLVEPATYVFNGQVHIWRFKNGLYATDFKKKNAAFLR